jgi:hypothetical protein
MFNSIEDMEKKTASMQKELLELLLTLSDGTVSDWSSSVTQNLWFTRMELNFPLGIPGKQ